MFSNPFKSRPGEPALCVRAEEQWMAPLAYPVNAHPDEKKKDTPDAPAADSKHTSQGHSCLVQLLLDKFPNEPLNGKLKTNRKL